MSVSFSMMCAEYSKMLSDVDTDLIRQLEESGMKTYLAANKEVKIKSGVVYLIHKGVVAVEVANMCDGGHESLHLGSCFPGMFLGIVENYGPTMPLTYITEEVSELIEIPGSYLEQLMAQHECWCFLLCSLSFMIAFLCNVNCERSVGSSYSVIRSLIYRYNIRANEGHHTSKESLISFILKRVNISRSYVFQVLSDLKLGGYIKMESGKLKSILKKLPERY